ncbi:DUF2975 domain-containing protein [Chitinophaga sp. GCM10012297]|uniref:DUF2975 domain-containing protein n=1 Tax=Chitinophaga chungangae TaxID=2821488 RepID=A0ABS3YBV1_9BACT|nr:DUF2975 domain-containing protein [Chitinophaga chungangae]MBO9152145.1 DUF2975 domain-containing protein [Chitinophaga chungangae]
METGIKHSTRTGTILRVMYFLSWIAFIGMAIKTGSLIIAWLVSWQHPEAAQNLYAGLDLHGLREADFTLYTMSLSFLVALNGLKATVLYVLINLLSKVNLSSPFKIEIAKLTEKISFILLSTWIVAMLNNAFAQWAERRVSVPVEQWSTDEYFFITGLVFIIAQIFKRGAELQSENELTV